MFLDMYTCSNIFIQGAAKTNTINIKMNNNTHHDRNWLVVLKFSVSGSLWVYVHRRSSTNFNIYLNCPCRAISIWTTTLKKLAAVKAVLGNIPFFLLYKMFYFLILFHLWNCQSCTRTILSTPNCWLFQWNSFF